MLSRFGSAGRDLRQIWLFGSLNGRGYGDNSKALFEYVHAEHHSEVRPIWLSKSLTLVHSLRKKGFEAHTFYSLQGMRSAFEASTLFISHSFLDLSYLSYIRRRGVKIIQLWHGTPLKRLEKHTFNLHKRLFLAAFLKYIGRDCDIVISATARNIEIYKRQFKVEHHQIKVTGQPRNDSLVARVENTGEKIVLFAPTWREYPTTFSFFSEPSQFDAPRLTRVLKSLNAKLFIKLHHADRTAANIQYTDVIRPFDSSIDLYDFLNKTDVLITDYSSVYFDFLLLDRPIIFSPFDLFEYEIQRGFYYDYESVTPGPKTMSWPELERHLIRIISGNDDHFVERRMVDGMFNDFQDNQSSKRVYDSISSAIYR